MSGTDPVITLACFLKLEAPGGDVNQCDGAFLDFDAGDGLARYESHHPIFGTIAAVGPFEGGIGGVAQSSTLTFIPDPDADLGDWFNDDLEGARVRFWMGEVDSDGKTVSSARQLEDLLVEPPIHQITSAGSQLQLPLIGRAQKLFLINEGNVCSERFHKSVWPGENGFNNCTDAPGNVAWGVAAPPSGSSGGGSAPVNPGLLPNAF